jgi:predicted metal-dependent phosphoesterase TrpH
MPLVDLHAHTKFSDGTTTPAEVVLAYLKAGVQMMAVTDHDTTVAVAQSAEKAAAAGMFFVPGVEISTREHDYLHILGYNINVNNQKLAAFLNQNRENRNIRVKKIIKKLQLSGLDIREEDVFCAGQNSSFPRAYC